MRSPTATLPPRLERMSLGGFIVGVLVLALAISSLRGVGFSFSEIAHGLPRMGSILAEMFPPNLVRLPQVLRALAETFQMAFAGTLIGAVLSLPLSVLAARNLSPHPVLRWCARALIAVFRVVPDLVWALLFVAVFGPGALAGTMAIAARSIGFVGKLLAEALEETQQGPIEALRATGAPWGSILLKGYWPQVQPAFWGIALFRWDINVRESAILGLVGAGGIGVALDDAINFFYWDRVAMVLATVFVVVVLAEILVTQIRKRII